MFRLWSTSESSLMESAGALISTDFNSNRCTCKNQTFQFFGILFHGDFWTYVRNRQTAKELRLKYFARSITASNIQTEVECVLILTHNVCSLAQIKYCISYRQISQVQNIFCWNSALLCYHNYLNQFWVPTWKLILVVITLLEDRLGYQQSGRNRRFIVS